MTPFARSYDTNGNRTNAGYSTTTNNRMTSDGTYNYTYDSEGNRTRKTAISGGAYVDYVWDYHNRLTDVKSYTSGGTLTQRIHYTYDVADRLIGRQIDTNGDGTYDSAARYVNDFSTPQTNGAPNGLGLGTGLDATLFAFNGSGSLTNRYLSGPAVDQVFADENAAGTIFWDLADNLGTIRDVAQYNAGTNTTTVVNHLKYDSFGNITAQSDSSKQPLFAYTGRQWDSAASLQYSRARWYDPKSGRFISEDPSGFGGGDVNLSRYVLNSPVDYVDPSGLEWIGGQNPIFSPPRDPGSLFDPPPIGISGVAPLPGGGWIGGNGGYTPGEGITAGGSIFIPPKPIGDVFDPPTVSAGGSIGYGPGGLAGGGGVSIDLPGGGWIGGAGGVNGDGTINGGGGFFLPPTPIGDAFAPPTVSAGGNLGYGPGGLSGAGSASIDIPFPSGGWMGGTGGVNGDGTFEGGGGFFLPPTPVGDVFDNPSLLSGSGYLNYGPNGPNYGGEGYVFVPGYGGLGVGLGYDNDHLVANAKCLISTKNGWIYIEATSGSTGFDIRIGAQIKW